MARTKKLAVIAGSGIAGLSVAITLRLSGWDVLICEAADKLEEVGAGLQISPNGVKLLKKWNVYSTLKQVAVFPSHVEMVLAKSGHRIFQIPLGETAVQRWGAEYIHVHRADLQNALLKRLIELAGDVVNLGCTVSGYENQDEQVLTSLSNGKTIKSDLLIGADGLNSNLRKQMHPDCKPRFTGNYAWRATILTQNLKGHAPPMNARIWAMAGRHAVTTRLRGGDLINFVGIVETDEVSNEGWKIKGDIREVKKDFGHIPGLRNIIEAATSIHRWGLYDHSPLPNWSEGSVVLIGDAAHPMLPSMAQGAVQSMEDAQILATCLSERSDIVQSCSNFYDTRIERVTKIQKTSVQNLNLFHKRSKVSQLITYLPILIASKLFPSLLHKRTDWIYNFESDA